MGCSLLVGASPLWRHSNGSAGHAYHDGGVVGDRGVRDEAGRLARVPARHGQPGTVTLVVKSQL